MFSLRKCSESAGKRSGEGMISADCGKMDRGMRLHGKFMVIFRKLY